MSREFSHWDFIDHDGPISRADGVRPKNGHLWPTEAWWPSHDWDRSYSSMLHFWVIHLADGRFATDGNVASILANRNCYNRPCVYATRLEAMRVSAGRMLRLARASRGWQTFDRHSNEQVVRLANWTREIVARESGRPAPRPLTVPPMKEQPKPSVVAGLPLFEAATGKAVGCGRD